MKCRKPLGISMIGWFYVFGAAVLLITMYTNPTEQFGIAMRFGLPSIPEVIIRPIVAAFSLVLAYGFIKLKKWGFWLMMSYSIYFLLVSLSLARTNNVQLFWGNAFWSAFVIVYALLKRQHFIKEKSSSD